MNSAEEKLENKVKTGIIGLISLLVVFGGTLYFTPEQLDNAYYCLATKEIGICYGGISGTGLTCYPHAENRSNYERCKKDGVNSVWVPLKDYAEEQGIDILDLMTQNETKEGDVVNVQYNGKEYFCIFTNKVINDSIISTYKCELVKNIK